MASSKINITINCNGNQRQQLYSKIRIDFQFERQKINKLNSQLSQICGTKNAPFLIIQLTNIDLKQIQIPTFKQEIFQHKQIIKNNKLYHYGNFKSSQTKKFLKSLYPNFKSLTQLKNKVHFQIMLYDIDKLNIEKKKEILWEKAKIQGQIKIDKQFMQNFKQILTKISPQFINSPIIVFLDLMQNLDFQVNLQKFDLISEQIRQKFHNLVNINQKNEPQILKKLKQNKQQMTIYINIGGICMISIKSCSNTLGTLFHMI